MCVSGSRTFLCIGENLAILRPDLPEESSLPDFPKPPTVSAVNPNKADFIECDRRDYAAWDLLLEEYDRENKEPTRSGRTTYIAGIH